MSKSYMVKKREIDALLENFNWETNPDWSELLDDIGKKIDDFWTNELKR